MAARTLAALTILLVAACASQPTPSPLLSLRLPAASLPSQVAPTPTPWTPSEGVARLLMIVDYHLDLWGRQTPGLGRDVLEGDPDSAESIGWAIEGNGAAFAWALADARMIREPCWSAYREAASRAANLIANNGSYIRAAVASGRAGDWTGFAVTRRNLEIVRHDLEELRNASTTCDRDGGPAPTDAPLPPP
jgi:hypothetical protein